MVETAPVSYASTITVSGLLPADYRARELVLARELAACRVAADVVLKLPRGQLVTLRIDMEERDEVGDRSCYWPGNGVRTIITCRATVGQVIHHRFEWMPLRVVDCGRPSLAPLPDLADLMRGPTHRRLASLVAAEARRRFMAAAPARAWRRFETRWRKLVADVGACKRAPVQS